LFTNIYEVCQAATVIYAEPCIIKSTPNSNKKLSCRRQTARCLCAKTTAWLTWKYALPIPCVTISNFVVLR